VLAVDFSYRLLALGVEGEFEFFNGTAEWTPPTLPAPRFRPSPLLAAVLRALRFGGRPRAAGEAFMRRAGLADERGAPRPFAAVHVRRGDMDNWRNRQHVAPRARPPRARATGCRGACAALRRARGGRRRGPRRRRSRSS
jgi:hypothetical protein